MEDPLQNPNGKWLTAKECMTLLECDPRKLHAILKTFGVRSRQGFGYRKWCRSDVEQIANPPERIKKGVSSGLRTA